MMRTRDEMGQALYERLALAAGLSKWEALQPLTRDYYIGVAGGFASWLEGERWEENARWFAHRPIVHDAINRYLGVPVLRCAKGHALMHPEDIERRYCGVCREFIGA